MSAIHKLDHQDIKWLGNLLREREGRFEAAEPFQHPKTGRQVGAFRAWSYESSTQTAIAQTAWEEVDTDGQVIDRWRSKPVRLHCVFRFEMEHLFARTGFEVEALYGDFCREALRDESTDMIWVARSGDSVHKTPHAATTPIAKWADLDERVR